MYTSPQIELSQKNERLSHYAVVISPWQKSRVTRTREWFNDSCERVNIFSIFLMGFIKRSQKK